MMIKEHSNSWCIVQDVMDVAREGFYESLFSLGNGYMGVRGFHEDDTQKLPHERSQFIAGIFDYIDSGITDMVNTPNYLHTKFMVDGEPFDINQGKVLDYKSILDMKRGTLTRTILWENNLGQITKVEKERFISLHHLHLACLRYTLTPINYSGELVIETGIDGSVRNSPINDDQMKVNNKTIKLLTKVDAKANQGSGYLEMLTQTRKEVVAESYEVKSLTNQEHIVENTGIQEDCYVGSRYVIDGHEGRAYTFEKYISVYTSRDGVEELKETTLRLSEEAGRIGYTELLRQHELAWAKKWHIADIQIGENQRIQQAIRYNIFQLIQTNAEHDHRVSIGARGIMHGRYKGCYFWDTEIFMLPFFLYTNPEAAKNLLLYRYHTLEGARENAKAMNLKGIKYPWMSSADGREQCESWDTGSCEIHINADIPYAIDHYYQVTGDVDFILNYGAEIYMETARYWSSRFSYDEKKDIYNMLFVKGPNEYGGVTLNNTYTSFMALHNIQLAMEAISLLKEHNQWEAFANKLDFEYGELDQWQDILDKAVIHYDEEKQLYIEDQHFFDLEPVSLEDFKDGETPLYKKICFDRLQRYRVLKQADVIQLMTLFPKAFTMEEKLVAWETYEPITLHDSTLSFGTHALFAATLGLDQVAWDYFEKSVVLDIEDVMHNTDTEGIHSASLGISWQAIIFGFAGLVLEDGELSMYPRMPKQWGKTQFNVVYRNNILHVSIMEDVAKVTLSKESPLDQMDIKIWDQLLSLEKGKIKQLNKPVTQPQDQTLEQLG